MEGLKLTFYVLLSGAVVFGLNLLVKGIPLDPVPDIELAIYLILLALIPTLVSDFTLILSVQHVGSTITAVLGCMEPVTAVAMGVLVLQEQLEGGQVMGIAVILLAVSIVILADSHENMRFKRLNLIKLWRKVYKF